MSLAPPDHAARGRGLPRRGARHRALREHEASPEPARLAPPTLILWDDGDTFLEAHVARAGLELCDDGHLVIVEGTTHWLHLEKPERINREILHFLGPG